MTDRCEHGAELEGHKKWPAGCATTEPLHMCQCCATFFYVLESAIYSMVDGKESDWTRLYEPADKSLCEQCGGKYVESGPFPLMVIQEQPSSRATDQTKDTQ